MGEKKLTGSILWHLVEEEGEPGRGQYLVTTEKGMVLPAKYENCLMKAEHGGHEWVWRWKLPNGVNVLAWAELPEPCEACPIEIIKARKQYERAKADYEKALAKLNEKLRGDGQCQEK